MGWIYAKLWTDLPDKPKVRREIREHGTGVTWVWACCILVAKGCNGKGAMLVESGQPFGMDDLVDKTSMPRDEVERCVEVLLRWGRSSPGKWLQLRDGIFWVANLMGRQETPDAERKRQAREATRGSGPQSPDCPRNVRGQSAETSADCPRHVDAEVEAEEEAQGATPLPPAGGRSSRFESDPIPDPEPEKARAPMAASIPFQSLADHWNQVAVPQGFPSVQKVAQHEKIIARRWPDHPELEYWFAVIDRIAASDKLRDGFDTWSGANFAWVWTSNRDRVASHVGVMDGQWDNVPRERRRAVRPDPVPHVEPPIRPDETVGEDAPVIWRDVLAVLLARDPGAEQWVAKLVAGCGEDGRMVLAAPDEFTARWIRDNYMDQIRDCAVMVLRRSVRISLRVAPGDPTGG